MLVITHAQCTDGFASAWVVRKVYPNAEFYPAYHGQDPPDVTNRKVIILDFAYKRQTMLEMHKKAKSVEVLDHHKTAADDLNGLPFCKFDMNKSGATIAWDRFKDHIKGEMPWLVAYAEDKDLHRMRLPFSNEINAALMSYPFDFKVWDALERVYPTSHITNSQLVSDGHAALRYQERLIEVAVQHARSAILDGYKVLASNTSVIFSEVANRLADNHPFGVAWYKREDGKLIHSLRSTDAGVDVSQVAARHSGGGHRNSAGFESNEMVLQGV